MAHYMRTMQIEMLPCGGLPTFVSLKDQVEGHR